MGTEVAAQCVGPSPCAYSIEVGGEPGKGWPGTPTRLGTVVVLLRAGPGQQGTCTPCHSQAVEPTLYAQVLAVAPLLETPARPSQVISGSRFSSSLSSGQPWHPRWLPRHRRRIHLGMRSHPAVHPELLPVRLGSFCLFPAPPWWQLSGRRKDGGADGMRAEV